MASTGSPGSGFGKFMLGFLLGVLLIAGGLTAYFKFGTPPVAVADHPFPLEKQLLRRPVNKRIDRELAGSPFGTSPEVFEAGAHVYMTECASCHGTPNHTVPFAKYMYPAPPQLWKKHGRDNAVGVTEETGRTYWKVANGIRLTGMPSFSKILTETQMWQVTLLLKHAADPMPDPVTAILKQSVGGGDSR